LKPGQLTSLPRAGSMKAVSSEVGSVRRWVRVARPITSKVTMPQNADIPSNKVEMEARSVGVSVCSKGLRTTPILRLPSASSSAQSSPCMSGAANRSVAKVERPGCDRCHRHPHAEEISKLDPRDPSRKRNRQLVRVCSLQRDHRGSARRFRRHSPGLVRRAVAPEAERPEDCTATGALTFLPPRLAAAS
jgi:hypothetical protein